MGKINMATTFDYDNYRYFIGRGINAINLHYECYRLKKLSISKKERILKRYKANIILAYNYGNGLPYGLGFEKKISKNIKFLEPCGYSDKFWHYCPNINTVTGEKLNKQLIASFFSSNLFICDKYKIMRVTNIKREYLITECFWNEKIELLIQIPVINKKSRSNKLFPLLPYWVKEIQFNEFLQAKAC